MRFQGVSDIPVQAHTSVIATFRISMNVGGRGNIQVDVGWMWGGRRGDIQGGCEVDVGGEGRYSGGRGVDVR